MTGRGGERGQGGVTAEACVCTAPAGPRRPSWRPSHCPRGRRGRACPSSRRPSRCSSALLRSVGVQVRGGRLPILVFPPLLLTCSSVIMKSECERDEPAFMPVAMTARFSEPRCMQRGEGCVRATGPRYAPLLTCIRANISSGDVTYCSAAPFTYTAPVPASSPTCRRGHGGRGEGARSTGLVA